MGYWIWLLIELVFALLEIITLGLTTIWFSVGSVAASIVSAMGGNWVIQTITFVIVTTIVIIFIRPIAVKYLNNKAEKTNLDAIIGKKGKVVIEINNINAQGKILLNGNEWTARSLMGEVIPKDSLVTVEKIEGVKVLVKEVKE